MNHEQLMARAIPEPNTGCWLWTMATNKLGYGILGLRKRFWLAHRLSYALAKEDPGPLLVLHKCDVPGCINPQHLYLGTDADNVRDMMERGRFRSFNSEKKLCKYGHDLEKYCFINAVGVRQCRICARKRNRDAYHRRKQPT